MTNQILYILIAINCMLFIVDVIYLLRLMRALERTRSNGDPLTVRGVNVSDQFPHRAYDLRQDGSIGSDEEHNKVIGSIDQGNLYVPDGIALNSMAHPRGKKVCRHDVNEASLEHGELDDETGKLRWREVKS